MQRNYSKLLFVDLHRNDHHCYSQTISYLRQASEDDRYAIAHYQNAAQALTHFQSESDDYDVLLLWLGGSHQAAWQTILSSFRRVVPTIEAIIIFDEDNDLLSSGVLMAEAFAFACEFNLNVLQGYIDAAIQKHQFSEFANEIRVVKKLDQMKTVIRTHLGQLIGYESFMVALVDSRSKPDDDPQYPRSFFFQDGYPSNQINPRLLRPLTQDKVMAPLIKSQHALIYPNLDDEQPDGWEVHPETENIRSWIGLPLIFADDIIGVLTLNHSQPGYYSNVYPSILGNLGREIAEAIERVMRDGNAEIAQRIASQIASEFDKETILETIFVTLSKRRGWQICSYWATFEDQGKLALRNWKLVADRTSLKPAAQSIDASSIRSRIEGQIIREQTSRIIVDAADLLDANEVEAIKRLDSVRDDFSLLLVPININGRTIGIIRILQNERDFFSFYDRDLLELIAQQVASIIERTWMLELNHQHSLNISQGNMGQQLSTPDPLKSILDEIVKNAVRLTNAHSGVIYKIAESESQGYHEIRRYSYPPDFSHPSPRLSDAESGTTRRLLGMQKIEAVPFDETDIQEDLRNKGINAVLGTPLIVEGKAIGVLAVNSTRDTGFNPIEQASLELFASHAAVAIGIANTRNQTQDYVNALENLFAASRSILRVEHNVQDTFQQIVDSVCDLTGAEYIHLAQLDHDDERNEPFLRFVAAKTKSEASNRSTLVNLQQAIGCIYLNSGSQKYPGRLGITGLAARDRTQKWVPVIDNNFRVVVQTPERAASPEQAEFAAHYIDYIENTGCELAIPFFDEEGELLGVINIEHREPYGLREHVRLIDLFSIQIAIAIRTSRLFDNLDSVKQRLTLLTQARQKILADSSEPIDNTFQNIAKYSYEALAGKDSNIMDVIVVRANEDGTALDYKNPISGAGLYTDEPLKIREHPPGISYSVFHGIHKKQHKVVDAKTEPDANETMAKAGVRTAICMLLEVKSRKLGVMWIHFNELHDVSEEEANIYMLHANQVAHAFHVIEQKSYAEERVKTLEETTLGDIEDDYQRARDQETQYHIISLLTSILGLILLFVAIVAFFFDSSFIGDRTDTISISSLVASIGAFVNALIFGRANAAAARSERYHRELFEFRALAYLIEWVEKIDRDKQVEAINDVIKKASQFWFDVRSRR